MRSLMRSLGGVSSSRGTAKRGKGRIAAKYLHGVSSSAARIFSRTIPVDVGSREARGNLLTMPTLITVVSGRILTPHNANPWSRKRVLWSAVLSISSSQSLFFTPVFLSLILAVKVRTWPAVLKSISCLLMLGSVAATVSFYHKIYDCPDAPFAKYALSVHMINPASALQDTSAYTAGVVNNFISVSRFANAIVPPKESVFGGGFRRTI